MSAVQEMEQDDSTFLYRHFGNDGRLLYVGISLNAIARLSQHRDASHWFGEIRKITIEKFPTRADATAAETKAIREEKPLHNIKDVEQASVIHLRRLLESRSDLLRQTVALQPVYRLSEVADVLKISDSKVRLLINEGQIGCVKQGSSKSPFVTGWQLLDYIESLTIKAKEDV